MNRSRKLAVAMCLLWGMHAPAHAQDKLGETRGELLYATHCIACHTEQVHWREKKLVTGWSSLVFEVRRWQASIGLVWSAEEIADTALYLNAAYYHFGADGTKKSSAEGY